MPEASAPDQDQICAACGAQLKPGANFCTTCGAAVGSGVPAAAASARNRTQPAASRPARQRKLWPWLMVVAVALALGLLAVLALNRPGPTVTAPAADGPAVTAPQQDVPYPTVPRVSPADAKARLDAGRAVVVDVRGDPYFQAGHIPGALSISLNRIEGGQHELPKNAEIITYCT